MRQLSVEHRYHVAPRREATSFLINAVLLGDLTDQEWRNKVANLPQDFEFVSALEWFCLFFHLLLVEQLRTHSNAFSIRLWDAPDWRFEISKPEGPRKGHNG